MKIPNEIIPLAYSISKDIYHNRITHSEGVDRLSTGFKLNINSVRDYVYNFNCLMEGQRFTRTLNIATLDFFIGHILSDYGNNQLLTSLDALKQHIVYIEDKQKIKRPSLRNLYNKYYTMNSSKPQLINDLEDILLNLKEFERGLVEGMDEEQLTAKKIIKNGRCFIAYRTNAEFRFVPSKFMGYLKIKISEYPLNQSDGRNTNTIISKILNEQPSQNNKLESEYIKFCHSLGIRSIPNLKKGRKFWELSLENDFSANLGNDDFPEGKLIERIHKFRERDKSVVDIAKRDFIAKYGKLYCQVCNFDFENEYGDLGQNFIEGHHTIAVADMQPGHMTKVEDIAMLCSNCHKMVHRRRPWLSMDQLKLILKKQK